MQNSRQISCGESEICCTADHSAKPGQDSQSTRRRALAIPAALAAWATLPELAEAAEPPAISPGAPATPEAAIAALMAGNRRYLDARHTACSQNLPRIFRETEHKQTPFAAVLSCADSRVPVELLFDQGIGQVFVARVAGNVASPEVIASLEYGVAILGVRAIVVLGHGDCGAVAATLARKPAPGQISSLYAFIRPAIGPAEGQLNQAIRINATLQARLLRDSSPVLAEAIAARRLGVTAAYYDVATGKVTLLPG